MSDDDYFDDDIRHLARTEGAQIAYKTAVAICQDPKAPANAKATAASLLLRLGGYLDRSDEAGGRGKDPSEMSAEELQAAIDRGRAELDRKPQQRGGLFD